MSPFLRKKRKKASFNALKMHFKAQRRILVREKLLKMYENQLERAQLQLKEALRVFEIAQSHYRMLTDAKNSILNELECERHPILTKQSSEISFDKCIESSVETVFNSTSACDTVEQIKVSECTSKLQDHLLDCWSEDDDALLNESNTHWMEDYRSIIRDRHLLIEKNFKLVRYVVNRYYLSRIRELYISVEDLLQEGYIGLIKAAARHDPNKGSFSTYAYVWVWQSIERAIRDQGYLIRVPIQLHKDLYNLEKANVELIQILGRVPTCQELADTMKTTKQNVEKMLQYLQTHSNIMDFFDNSTLSSEEDSTLLTSNNVRELTKVCEDDIYTEDEKGVDQFVYSTMDLQAFVSEDWDCWEEGLVDEDIISPFREIVMSELSEQTLQLFEKLSQKEMDVLSRRFGLHGYEEQTLEEIGQSYDLSRERIRQIETKAIQKLRHPANAKCLKPYYQDE